MSTFAGCFLRGTGVTGSDDVRRKVAGINLPGAIEPTSFSIGFGARLSMPVCYALRSPVAAMLRSELRPVQFRTPLRRIGAAVVLADGVRYLVLIGANLFNFFLALSGLPFSTVGEPAPSKEPPHSPKFCPLPPPGVAPETVTVAARRRAPWGNAWLFGQVDVKSARVVFVPRISSLDAPDD